MGFVVGVTESVVRWRWCKVEVEWRGSSSEAGGGERSGMGQRGSKTHVILKGVDWAYGYLGLRFKYKRWAGVVWYGLDLWVY